MQPRLPPRPLPSLPPSLPCHLSPPISCTHPPPSPSLLLGCLRSPKSARLPSDPTPRHGTPRSFPASARSFLGLRHTPSPLISLLEFAPSPPSLRSKVTWVKSSSSSSSHWQEGGQVTPRNQIWCKSCQGSVGVSGGTMPLGWTPLCACALAPIIPPWTSTAPTRRIGIKK